MDSLFSSPNYPKATPTAAAPKEEDLAVQQAAAEQARKLRMAQGFRGTILGSLVSPGQPGVQTPAQPASQKQQTLGS
jgi:hypothetical protein